MDNKIFYPPKELAEKAHIKSEEQYEEMYRQSVEHPEEFWARQAEQHVSWFEPWHATLEYNFEKPYVKFFEGGKLNVSYNCLDRHLNWRAEKTAIIWQGEDERERRELTYRELHKKVCQFANILKRHGAKKGTVVTIFMPQIPEAAIAMLACARIGAIHSVVFSAFSADALKNRIQDCGSSIVVTSTQGVHGGKVIPLKEKADEAVKNCPTVQYTLIYDKEQEFVDISEECEPEIMDAEDPLFILYTSGSTGKPKGVLHTTGGYLVYAAMTSKYIFDLQDKDVYWCSADVGWITGHSYVVYGPLANGVTTLMFEGIPTYPTPDRFWNIIEKEKVSVFYTAPTAIRALMRLGDEWPNRYDLSSLRILGSVGEPINPEAWMWYFTVIGKEQCPIMDTWWQTETGGIMITPLPGALPTKPGSASKPFFGIVPEIIDGKLVITRPWPGMMRGVYGDSENKIIKDIYFSQFPGKYFTGDGCKIDDKGFYWLQGRIDDVMNISGHRFATAEIEHALVNHQAVAEAAVVGFPHEVKGQGMHCFVTLKQTYEPTEELRQELVQQVRREIGPIATPDKIQFAEALPKTRSGKIMRRILRKIAAGETEEIGDTTTLADPTVIDKLLVS